MKKLHYPFSIRYLSNSLLAMLLVFAATIPMWLIGRDTLGEAAIGLLYLLPVGWSTYRWGKLPGISAALTAGLTFNFLFIPPFFTFAIARLEGWLVLAIFLIVAGVIVEQIQTSIIKAREATFMYELCNALINVRTPEAVAHTITTLVQQLFQADLVRVIYMDRDSGLNIVVSHPESAVQKSRPDRDLPLLNAWGFVGELQIWRGTYTQLPSEDSALLQNFALQAAKAFERVEVKKSVENQALIKPGK